MTTMTALGDLARHLMLNHARSTNKNDVNRLTLELASGKHADPAAILHGNLGSLGTLENGLARISGWQFAAHQADLRLQAMQTATSNMAAIARNQIDALLFAVGNMQASAITQAGDDAMVQLDAVLGLLNTQAVGHSVFAGIGSDRPAVSTAAELIAALTPVVMGQPDADAAFHAVHDWFNDPAGFVAQFYQGGDPASPIAISDNIIFRLDVLAIEPAFRNLLAGLSAAALAGHGIPATGVTARQVIRHAGEFLMTAVDGLVQVGGQIGRHQAQTAQAMARNAAEQATFELARAELLAADPFQTATALEQATTNLELIHLVTARLHHLSLAGVLR